jgi:mannose/fructose/N-acetylgalactosamine-specific phosphotransferase system component IIB
MEMEVPFFRIDDRLIHGQVVLSWVKYLKTRRIILCDNAVADNDWETQLYMTCVPTGLECIVTNTKDTTDYIMHEITHPDKTIVLVKAPAVLREITDFGLIPGKVNIGGIHYAEKRKEYLPYVFLSDDEIKDIKSLTEKGITIYCQDVPTSKKYNIIDLINSKSVQE